MLRHLSLLGVDRLRIKSPHGTALIHERPAGDPLVVEQPVEPRVVRHRRVYEQRQGDGGGADDRIQANAILAARRARLGPGSWQ
jgi:hypothetical protein